MSDPPIVINVPSTAAYLALNQQVQQSLADNAHELAQVAAARAAFNLPPWTVSDNQPGYVEILLLREDAADLVNVVLPNSGVTVPTVELELI